MTKRVIPSDVSRAQTRASDPAVSAFVAANAGAGKTHVLVQRVIRLMLAGVAPGKILCITFTKAAAANMAERVFTTLGQWVKLDDRALTEAIRNTGLERIDGTTLRRARELFAEALETPGGLKVQTIHALCTRLLQQFPFEANVAAHFAVLDDRDQAEMLERANVAVLLDAAADPDGATGRALAHAMSIAADVTFREVVREACLNQDLNAFLAEAGPANIAARLSQAVGAQPGDEVAALRQEIAEGPHLPLGEWETIAKRLSAGSKSDQEQASRLREALAAAGKARVDCYLAIFMTADGPRKTLITKGLRGSDPALSDAVDREAARLPALLDRLKAAAMRDRSLALLTIVARVTQHYRIEKERRGALDYDDLIAKTLQMLDRMPGSWVHYKLDRGIDHVLIDEAQDTSPQQWEIVTRLVEEFHAGEGAREAVRTLFAVGDEKQSIFSFQGAVMREFDARRRVFEARFKAADLTFDNVRFNYSFRSGESILTAVDNTFSRKDVFASVTTDQGGMEPHNALPDAAPGVIDLWELEKPDQTQEVEGWRAPFDAIEETSPQVKLARRIARSIAAMIQSETIMRDGVAQPVRAGDILILVRRRGALFVSVIQALKQMQIDVAGADRLKLTEHGAVIDLMSLADALLLPQDDLALAVALKSPLFGLDDGHLMWLAPERTGSLRDALRDHAQNPEIEEAWQRLTDCEARAGETPFAFFSWLLGAAGGRARILRRFGPEANDALDEFLELALGYEKREAATLQGFMHWLRAADIEIKRDMDVARSEVRVMTVHGAKGLEAPVVFLIDTVAPPLMRDRLMRVPQPVGLPNAAPCVAWTGREADDPPALATARARAKSDATDEYRRLLYVAMTRAAERLVVCGHMPRNRNTIDANCWYALIKDGLEGSGLQEEAIEGGKRFRKPGDAPLPAATVTAAPASPQPEPAWLRRRVATQAAPRLLRPSDADEPMTPGAGSFGDDARRRGVIAHRLLQSLPDIAADKRAAAAERYLARNAADWPEDARGDMAKRTLALIENFAPLFGPGSRAEVPLVGRLTLASGERAGVSGQIDRLVVTERDVLIADFKTNRTVPKRESEVPRAYLRQLALYRALLQKLYPKLTVHAALIWTETPEMMELSQAALDAELNAITGG